jgi:hypothetical protein
MRRAKSSSCGRSLGSQRWSGPFRLARCGLRPRPSWRRINFCSSERLGPSMPTARRSGVHPPPPPPPAPRRFQRNAADLLFLFPTGGRVDLFGTDVRKPREEAPSEYHSVNALKRSAAASSWPAGPVFLLVMAHGVWPLRRRSHRPTRRCARTLRPYTRSASRIPADACVRSAAILPDPLANAVK